jgi:hypothetical protein
VILKRRCQLALTRITHQVSRAFDLNNVVNFLSFAQKQTASFYANTIRFRLYLCT